MERSYGTNKKQEKIGIKLQDNKIKYPVLKNSIIEKETKKLLNDFIDEKNEKLSAPIPVFDIIEYLGYDVDFRKDGVYKDKDVLGGTLIDKKIVEINENLSEHDGRMHFTAAHEVGHIILHVPLYKQNNNKDISDNRIISRKDAGFEGNKKEPEEWQADKFAAFLLMPSALIKKAFFKNFKRPINVRKKSIRDFFLRKPAFIKGYQISEKIIRTGRFNNVSKMAMLNRLIGMGLVKGLSYQKASPRNKKRS